jgi:hypothetical protein
LGTFTQYALYVFYIKVFKTPIILGYAGVKSTFHSDKVHQLLAHGRWFSPGTPASSTTKTGRHDIAEILLKMALSTINQIKSNLIYNNAVLVIIGLYELLGNPTT